MRRRSEAGADTPRRTRTATALPLAAALFSALALTGAAVYTVDRASCGPGQYVRHGSTIELVGGCVDGTELDQLRTTPRTSGSGTADDNYRP